MIFKARPCAKLADMISTDTIVIANVRGSHQLGRVLHEMITVSILGHRASRGVHTLPQDRDKRRELRVELLESIEVINRGATVNRSTLLQGKCGSE